MTRIIKLTESDLSRIIDKVLNESTKKRKILSEQKLNTDGTYTVKNEHAFQMEWVNGDVVNYSITIHINENTIVKKGSDGKSVEFDIYSPYFKIDENGEYIDDSGYNENYVGKGKINCGELVVKLKDNGEYFLYNGLFWKYNDSNRRFYSKYGNAVILSSVNDITRLHDDIVANGGVKIIFYTQTEPSSDNSFATTMNKLFCDGRKLKSKPVQKPSTQSKCKFVEKEFKNQEVCFLSGDTEWMYAKTDDGKWYTTRQTDKKTWCELTAPKFQKAINILVAGCKGLQPVPELKIKELEPIDTSTNDMVLKKTEQQKSEFENKMKNLPQ